MFIDYRLKPVSRKFYLSLFAGWSDKAIRAIERQLAMPGTTGAICFEDLDLSSCTVGARAHLPVGSEWTLQEFSAVFSGDEDQLGRSLESTGRPKYPVFGYKIPASAEEQHWEVTFDRHWQRYEKLTPNEHSLLRAILVDTNVEMSRYYAQLSLFQTVPATTGRGLANAAS